MKHLAFKEQVAELVANAMSKSSVVQKAIIEALDICANVMAEEERTIALEQIAKVETHIAETVKRGEINNAIKSELTNVVLCVVARCFEAYPHFIDEERHGIVWDLDSATCAELGIEFAEYANFDGECWWSYVHLLVNPQIHHDAVPAILRCFHISLESEAHEHLRFPTTFDRFKVDLCDANVDFYAAQNLSIEDAQAALDWLKQYKFLLVMTSSKI